MKKTACLLLALVLFASALAGCARNKARSVFEADNEIFTYQRIDPRRTQLVVSRTGNIPVEKLCEAFQEQNPDIQVIYLDITGGDDKCAPLEQWIENGDTPDVVITGGGFASDNMDKYFVNLSGDPIIQCYESAALQRTAIDSNIYCLPGPSDISAMIYNKTLFDQYGWEVPATFDEFVSLCDQIREDTDGEIEPWNPNAKYSNELLTALEAFTYEELFAGVENRSWYYEVLEGSARPSGKMAPFFEVIQTLVDHGILREEHFSYSATARGKEFDDGKIAMINMSIYDADNDMYDFAFMPFPTTEGSLGYLCSSYSCFVGVPQKEHTKAQKEAIDRFLEFFSSEDGQRAYIGNTLKISNINGIALNQSGELSTLSEAVDAGHMFNLLDFRPAAGGPAIKLHELAADMASHTRTVEECLAEADAQISAAADGGDGGAIEIIATAEKDFSVLETSFLIADAYRQTADADIGLIANNAVFRGNLMRIYAGDITPGFIHVLKPRSFANGSALVKVSMTGRQLMDALNAPLGNDGLADCVYAYSGLVCQVAPWNEPGSRYLSVRLPDGGELDMNGLYTVAVWDGTVAPEYITETLETCEGTWEEMMTETLRAAGTISPAEDGRIRLSWK